ncbi:MULTISPECIES: ABC transporter ATP-binding protein [unclassified Mesorhizobium]|uniref:ABC transporter ATP-binding protein n=1 Tax=unclassified Mesorhizobium TaxID=325217 RepID=UPI0024154FD3|nr:MULTISPECIES: ABC transporter ATP-binding protein [unclassified Mesorhizobium]MDG4890097.1 ABC transporter ATP-binding protein [Mesorhizobium sp. WSM4887]MDG4904239.1 ABC transporter ATP-binding protein [Mesorhizobium sp. WSM4962]MDG4909266.1 ABC transporter ATP-binding protein [Mesorhizobium sp. WSM4898]MDG4921890.1 ABC transporter ATP-binding protein [Mesorhizobium sp. WSM4989]
MTKVRFERVSKMFGDYTAVQELNFEINDGEFLVLVGPSGCGKTTTLRMLAGLETPSYGRIWIDDKDVTLLPPGERGISMVFQSYALYPHMTVAKNLSFGMEVRHEPKAERAVRVRRVAEMLGLTSMLDRKPAALSGGQRQRVALGRAMIHEPKLFLLDEPLSNLDAALRTQMRFEISDLQKRLGVPTVYVTHDQVEAMTMGHRIAVFARGHLMQIGTPQELFRNPMNREVASFIGSPKMNIVDGDLFGIESRASVRLLGGSFKLSDVQVAALSSKAKPKVQGGIRPQDLHWMQDAPSRCDQRISGRVVSIETTGAESFVMVKIDEDLVNAKFPSFAPVKVDDTVDLAFDVHDLHLFDPETGDALLTTDVSATKSRNLSPSDPSLTVQHK